MKEYASQYLGVELDITNAATIQKSVQSIENPELRQLISILVLKTMEPPKYFCAGAFDISKYSHFALGTPLFTHFTAPLRRYVDIVVHRQLEAALIGGKHIYSQIKSILTLLKKNTFIWTETRFKNLLNIVTQRKKLAWKQITRANCYHLPYI